MLKKLLLDCAKLCVFTLNLCNSRFHCLLILVCFYYLINKGRNFRGTWYHGKVILLFYALFIIKYLVKFSWSQQNKFLLRWFSFVVKNLNENGKEFEIQSSIRSKNSWKCKRLITWKQVIHRNMNSLFDKLSKNY